MSCGGLRYELRISISKYLGISQYCDWGPADLCHYHEQQDETKAARGSRQQQQQPAGHRCNEQQQQHQLVRLPPVC
jgi:hypothetical protein